jgi:hypothetical protein
MAKPQTQCRWRQEPTFNSGSGTLITEINRIHLVLSDMQNRTFGPYSAAMDWILISLVAPTPLHFSTCTAEAGYSTPNASLTNEFLANSQKKRFEPALGR